MVLTDPISDMLTIIRNGLASRKEEVIVWDSNLKTEILEKLKREAFIAGFKKEAESNKGKIVISLRYLNSDPAITSIKRISKPGRRIYVDKANIGSVKGGRGRLIISTSKGILTNIEARKMGVGGEVMLEVW